MAAQNEKLRVVVVGGVAGGASAAARVKRLNENADVVVCASSTLAPFLSPFFIWRRRDGLKRSSAFFELCNELRTRNQLTGK